MKTTSQLLAAFILLQAMAGLAVPPVNDDFENRTVLTGNDVTFAADLTEATFQDYTPLFDPYNYYGISSDVWWSWTASRDCEVAILLLSPNLPDYLASENAFFGVYTGTNLTTLNPVCFNLIDVVPYRHIRFRAQSNNLYQIRAAVSAGSPIFHLSAAPEPIILVQPRSVTVFPEGSALFTTWAAGTTNLQFQWRFNGVDLPGETCSMLAMDNITTNQMGDYSATVAGPTGTNVSTTAHLFLVQEEVHPVVSIVPASRNGVTLMLNGEIGRSYLLESSTNLASWSPETMLWLGYGQSVNRVVNAAADVTSLTVASVATRKFFRFSRHQPLDEIINNGLKQVAWAKLMFVQDSHWLMTSVATDREIVPYLKGQRLPNGFVVDNFAEGALSVPPRFYTNGSVQPLFEPLW